MYNKILGKIRGQKYYDKNIRTKYGKWFKTANYYTTTGAQVSIVSESFLKSQLSSVQIQDIEQLLGSYGSISLQAANGTDIHSVVDG